MAQRFKGGRAILKIIKAPSGTTDTSSAALPIMSRGPHQFATRSAHRLFRPCRDLISLLHPYPPLKRWAIFGFPFGKEKLRHERIHNAHRKVSVRRIRSGLRAFGRLGAAVSAGQFQRLLPQARLGGLDLPSVSDHRPDWLEGSAGGRETGDPTDGECSGRVHPTRGPAEAGGAET